MELQAYLNAQENYKGYIGRSTGIFFLTVFSLGTIGLPVTIAESSTNPSIGQLGIKDVNLINNKGYIYFYKQEAFRIKKRHIWLNYGIALTIDVFIASLILFSRIHY